MNKFGIFFCVFLLAVCGRAYSQTLDTEIQGLSHVLGKRIVAKGIVKIATVDFVDLQGRSTELGRFLSEQLSDELVNEPGIRVLDRANIKSILEEHKLSEEGLVKQENAVKLGQFAGVDAILIGRITTLDNTIVLNVKALSVKTSQIVAAAKANIRITPEIQKLANRLAVSSSSGGGSDKEYSGGSDQVEVKDFGNIRLERQGSRLIKDDTGQSLIQVTFGITNRNTDSAILFAVNGDNQSQAGYGQYAARASLIDPAGNNCFVSSCNGLPMVAAKYNVTPASIANIINRGSPHVAFDALRPVSSGSFYSLKPGEKPPPPVRHEAWAGEFFSVPATQNTTFSITFRNANPQASRGSAGFQFQGELVFGEGDPEEPSKCRLTTVTFDNIRPQ